MKLLLNVQRMNPKLRLAMVLSVAIAVAAVGSHVTVRLLGVRTGAVGYRPLSSHKNKPLAFAEGSSLMVDGLSWERISKQFGTGIENWFVAGSSPSEWEQLQERTQH